MTQVVFDHALRVRLKANVANTNRDNLTAMEIDSASGQAQAAASGDNMTGKINNLVTADLNVVQYANEFLLVGQFLIYPAMSAVSFADFSEQQWRHSASYCL